MAEEWIEILHPTAHAQEGPLRELLEAQQQFALAASGAEHAREARDDAIRHATDAGLTRRTIARATDLTAGRIQQIIDGSR
jgi:hypothetical protein